MIYKILNKTVGLIRGREFVIDQRVPILYLVNMSISFILAYFRGVVFFRSRKPIFIGKNTTLLCKNKFRFNGKNVKIARNCYIDALSLNGITFGSGISIQKNVSIECTGSIKDIGVGLLLGDNVGIGSNSFLGCAGGIEIGDDTIIGNFVSFHSENHNVEELDTPIRLQGINRKGIVIGKNCWIGAKVTILDGTVVGDDCVIAAGAVLTGKKYASRMVIGGVPATVIRERLNAGS